MKVKDLIELLSLYNSEAKIKIIINGIMFIPLESLSYGYSDNIGKDKCEEVYIEIPLSNDEHIEYIYKGE